MSLKQDSMESHMIYGVFSTGIPSRKFFTFTSTNAINSKMQFLLIDIDSGSTMCRTISVIRYFANLEGGKYCRYCRPTRRLFQCLNFSGQVSDVLYSFWRYIRAGNFCNS